MATVGLSMLAFGASTGPASAAELLATTVSVRDAVERSCIDQKLSGAAGHTQRSVPTPAFGWVTARLEAASGDWDVAIFDDATGRRVAGSAFFGASEVAQGFVRGGEQLIVQACRRSGSADTASLTVNSKEVPGGPPVTLSIVRVSVPNAARKTELTGLGLDLTEHGRAGFVDVVLHGDADARKLREAKFVYTTEIADLVARGIRDRRTDRRFSASVSKSALPSGRAAGYRRLDDYNNEMKALVTENPNLVKPITLKFKTLTGLPVQGIEITTDVNKRDGKPVFLQMGVHHAREWPSGEHAMEWAYELVNGVKARNPRVVNLVASTRTIVVPIVNPEGFNTSREAPSAMDDGAGGPDDTANFASRPYEYQRKNCRVNNTADDDFRSTEDDDPEEGDCTQLPAQGLSQFGTDPNRNYGGFWGGPGASGSGEAPGGDFAQDYRGNGPFSERETKNIQDLVSTRHVTTLITNHTFSNLLLRPPAIAAQGPTVDDPAYKALGDTMASANGYSSEPSFMLYDTSGGTEDWSYYTTGGFGFTFEIGPTNFHPPYADVVAEYEGTSAAAKGGGGNREAYFRAMENTADAAKHSVIDGGAPAGAILRLKKTFKTKTSPVVPVLDANGEPTMDEIEEPILTPILFDDVLETTMEVPSSGKFDWHINPSTRPVVAQGEGRPANGGKPSPADDDRKDQLASQPPCPTYFDPGSPETCVAGGVKDEPFEIPANVAGQVDNGFAKVTISFPEDADMDLEVYRADADGKATGAPVASAATSANPEEATIGPDPPPGKYVARVINFAGGTTYDLSITFSGPKAFVPPIKESWTLTCEVNGQVRASQQVQIDRGQRKVVDFGSACPGPPTAAQAAGAKPCLSSRGGARDRRLAKARLGRTRISQRKVLTRARTLKARNGIDRYCVKGGGTLRIGYPTKRLNASLSRVTRKGVNSKAVLIVSTNRRFKLRGLKVGSKVSALKRRLRAERRFKIGRSAWYVARGKRSAILFRARGGKVREIGVANRVLTSRPAGVRRLLRAWGSGGL